MNSDTFNRFIDTLFTILDRLEKEYSAEDVIKEFKKVLKKAYFTEGSIIRDVSEEDQKLLISKQEGKAEEKVDVIKNLLIKHMSIEDIADVVKLSINDVKNIIKENNFDTTSE